MKELQGWSSKHSNERMLKMQKMALQNFSEKDKQLYNAMENILLEIFQNFSSDFF